MIQKERSQMTLRMNQELDAKIEANAKSVGISKNAYVLLLLNQAMKGEQSGVSA